MGTRKKYKEKVKEICRKIVYEGYDSLKTDFNEIYISKRNTDSILHGDISVEDRFLHFNEDSKISSKDRIILKSIIEKIKKENYKFSNTDKDDLVLFNKKIDFAIAQCQYITNIFDGENNYVKGHHLEIITLFNDIKSSKSNSEFFKITQIDKAFIKDKNFKSFLIYLFALVKNIEDKNSYPIYYKYYQNISKYFFNIDHLDYDKFCVHFRETNFNKEPKLLEFNTYYYLLGENLKQKLKLNGLANELVDKRWLKNNLFNVDSDSIDDVNTSFETIENNFRNYLENNVSKASVKKYLGGISFVDKISFKIGLEKLYEWKLSEIINNKEFLFKDVEFEKQNTTGNNMYSAVVNHYHKFLLKMEEKDEIITPQLPFDSFGWRWASTGIASHLNNPKSLKIVLDALLINGNGRENYTQGFKDLIHKLCINKYSISEEDSDKLSKISNPNVGKNIIENSANYWYHIGLIETTGQNTEVSDLGKKLLNGLISNDEFISDRIDNYYLPNKAYKSTDTKKWSESSLKIYPLKLIQNIFIHLFKNYASEHRYISESDLINIIIPCSSDIIKFNVEYITHHIIEYRKDSSKYSLWPKPQSNYTDDKGLRMANEFLYFLEVFGFLTSNKATSVRNADKKYKATNKFIDVNEVDTDDQPNSKEQISFNMTSFSIDCSNAGLVYSNELLTRYVSALATKPFVLLSGLSGSGKTKLAEAYAKWICDGEEQYALIPVGADWTNREPLLGYPNALKDNEYVKPDNDALDLLLRAKKDENRPYFLILDEMNLSHVERYFADFLSTMESKNSIPLHKMEEEVNNIPKKIKLPKNLFIVGTVNIDETTYMFSPKVLDRANTIEFRVSHTDISSFLKKPNNIDLEKLNGKGTSMAVSFLERATATKNGEKIEENYQLTDSQDVINHFFKELQKSGAEFGYRTAFEISKLIYKLHEFGLTDENEKLDIAIMQKMLPKLHGSRTKLSRTLKPLAKLCLIDVNDKFDKEYFENFENIDFKKDKNIKYKLSFEKIMRMYTNAVENGFASYAEA